MMLEELQRRNYSQSTTRAYVRVVRELAAYFHQPPDRLGPDHLRQFQAHLFRERKLNARTVVQYSAALRFFFVKTLKRHYLLESIPLPKEPRTLPTVLSQGEVTTLIESASNLMHRAILMTLYATGMRRAELCNLKVSDIDRERMVIHIHQGKGQRDREVMPVSRPQSCRHTPHARSSTLRECPEATSNLRPNAFKRALLPGWLEGWRKTPCGRGIFNDWAGSDSGGQCAPGGRIAAGTRTPTLDLQWIVEFKGVLPAGAHLKSAIEHTDQPQKLMLACSDPAFDALRGDSNLAGSCSASGSEGPSVLDSPTFGPSRACPLPSYAARRPPGLPSVDRVPPGAGG